MWEDFGCDGPGPGRAAPPKGETWCFLIPSSLQGIDPINQTKVVEILKEGDGTERRRSLGGGVKYENATDGSEEVSMGVEWSGVSTRHHQERPQLAAGGKGQPGSGLSPCGLSWHPRLPPFIPSLHTSSSPSFSVGASQPTEVRAWAWLLAYRPETPQTGGAAGSWQRTA